MIFAENAIGSAKDKWHEGLGVDARSFVHLTEQYKKQTCKASLIIIIINGKIKRKSIFSQMCGWTRKSLA